VTFAVHDRVEYSPEFIARTGWKQNRGRVWEVSHDRQIVNVAWDDRSECGAVHHENLSRIEMKPEVTSRPLPGTPYREHILTLGDVELRVQMSAFTPEEIAEAVDLYKHYGICTPRHQNTSWNGHAWSPPTRKAANGGEAPDPITYNGLYVED